MQSETKQGASQEKVSMDEDCTRAPKCHHDVTVIGAGWSGLVTCKYMLEEGLSVVTLEQREAIGGTWLYSDDTQLTTVMKTTHCTSSSTVTEMSDFPMPEEIGIFPHHTDIVKYLHLYAEAFNLAPHIRLNTSVLKVEKEEETWKVTCASGKEYTSSFLVVAVGSTQKPNRELEEGILKGFTGKIYHAQEIKEPLAQHRGERLLLVGGGETGSDLCLEWKDHVRFIYWSIPRGQHFFKRYTRIVPWKAPQALDKASSRALTTVCPYVKSKPGLAWICKFTTQGSLLAYQGHGIPEWRNNADFFRFYVNKNGRVLDFVDYETLVPKGAIEKCSGKEVTFQDGSKQEFDIVIQSTGYTVEYPFLPERYASVGLREKHKFVFDIDDPSIAFVGHVRPVVGSVVSISEQQARWVAKVFSGHVPLQTLDERRKEVQQDTAHWSKYFANTSKRIEGLVEGFTYIDDIARHAEVMPDLGTLLRTNPRRWYTAVFSPFNMATYRLDDPKYSEQAVATMERHRRGTMGPVVLLFNLFLRLILFDLWLNWLGYFKYRIQVSSWWPMVRAWRVTRAVNYIWCLPKRVLYDSRTDIPLKVKKS